MTDEVPLFPKLMLNDCLPSPLIRRDSPAGVWLFDQQNLRVLFAYPFEVLSRNASSLTHTTQEFCSFGVGQILRRYSNIC